MGGTEDAGMVQKVMKSMERTNWEEMDLLDSEADGWCKGRPLKSGILTKPNKAGIKIVVRYTYRKLSHIHVESRNFAKLFFHNFVAGELELVLDDSMKPNERVACLNFLQTLAYITKNTSM